MPDTISTAVEVRNPVSTVTKVALPLRASTTFCPPKTGTSAFGEISKVLGLSLRLNDTLANEPGIISPFAFEHRARTLSARVCRSITDSVAYIFALYSVG